MQQNILKAINKIFYINFRDSVIKTEYLYNEFFISISDGKDFCLFGILLKADNITIQKYSGEKSTIGVKLELLIKKYENLFLSFLKFKRINLFNLGDESEFINIFDKEELKFIDIKNKLDFSFLDDYSYRRKIQNEFKLEDKSILDIYHSDFECSKCSGPREAFTSFQNFDDIIDKKYFISEFKKTKSEFLYTNVNDYESITIGGNEKINEILSDKKLIDKHDMISLNKTCISVIMGDDLGSIFKYNNIPEEKYLYTDQNIDSPYRTIINYLKTINLSEFNQKNNKILFFGLNKNKNTFEIIQFLQNNFGLEVGNVLLPNINKEDLFNILNYNLAVFFSGREVKAQNLFKLYPINQFDFKIPYGITKFEELIQNILQKFGKEEYLEKLSEIINKIKEDNIILHNKARNLNLGFIIHDFHIRQFLLDNFRGVPILSLFRDMGFHLHFFIYSYSDKYKKDIDEFNSKNDLDNKNNFNTIISSRKEDLNIFLSDINIQSYYSEIANDKRILEKNKEQFSVGDFEYGIDGFYRTLSKIIKKCEKQKYNSKYFLNN
ncbi:MAG: hypothetical protein PHZ26_02475 [Candidatus Gracilibacteria bacterium]|nr:hypothetical protein [Candidatus Gracilibacteria bacterium]MDD2908598.1 hypothetical protein [Candidatus Gracilibacteria bacterium]